MAWSLEPLAQAVDSSTGRVSPRERQQQWVWRRQPGIGVEDTGLRFRSCRFQSWLCHKLSTWVWPFSSSPGFYSPMCKVKIWTKSVDPKPGQSSKSPGSLKNGCLGSTSKLLLSWNFQNETHPFPYHDPECQQHLETIKTSQGSSSSSSFQGSLCLEVYSYRFYLL